MKCSKCGKETNVVCLCGMCDECNGVDEEVKESFDKWLKEQEIKNERKI